MGRDTPALLGGPAVRRAPYPPHNTIAAEEQQAAMAVLRSGVLSGFMAVSGDAFYGGPQVRRLEQRFAEFFGVPHAIAVNSATSGLHCALVAAGVSAGDEVVVPPMTMTATATAVRQAGGWPRFADVSPQTCNLDPQQLVRHINARTKAIVVVHLFGLPADMDSILSIAQDHGLRVIEDAAQAPAACLGDRLAATIGDIGVLSLNCHKTIQCGEGGVVLTRSASFEERVRLVRNHGESVVGEWDKPQHTDILGYNYRMTELEAAIGEVQLSRLSELNQWRIELAEYLHAALGAFEGLEPVPAETRRGHVYYVFPMRIREEAVGLSRRVLCRALQAEGLEVVERYCQPLYWAPYYQDHLLHKHPESLPPGLQANYRRGSCPVAERLHDRALFYTTLCRYPLTRRDIDDFLAALRKIYAHRDELRSLEAEGCALAM